MMAPLDFEPLEKLPQAAEVLTTLGHRTGDAVACTGTHHCPSLSFSALLCPLLSEHAAMRTSVCSSGVLIFHVSEEQHTCSSRSLGCGLAAVV